MSKDSERKRAARAADPEKYNAQMRAWKAANPEKTSAYHAAWRSSEEGQVYRCKRLERERQERIAAAEAAAEATGEWILAARLESGPALPQTFNHVTSDCTCTGRRCRVCEKVKCVGQFYMDKRRPNLARLECKFCTGVRTKTHKAAHADQTNATNAVYRRTTKGKRRGYWLKTRYGITLEQYQAMLEQQGGCCALCGLQSPQTLHVDHDHVTGKVRALLCSSCNSLIGYADESIERLEQAIDYLAKHQENRT